MLLTGRFAAKRLTRMHALGRTATVGRERARSLPKAGVATPGVQCFGL